MDISAKQVMELRRSTGLGMMQCKGALQRADGDYERAVEILRREGLKAADSKAGRKTAEGLLGLTLTEDRRAGTMVQVLCETEPVRNTPLFGEFVARLTHLAAEKGPAGTAALLALPWSQPEEGTDVETALRALVARLGENIVLSGYRQFRAAEGVVGAYVHHDRKTGAMVSLRVTGVGARERVIDFSKDLCMHIVFSRPQVLDRDAISPEEVEREVRILKEQVGADPALASKPAAAVESIVRGRLEKNFFGERVLGEQPWYRDAGRKVTDLLSEHGVEVVEFALFQPVV